MTRSPSTAGSRSSPAPRAASAAPRRSVSPARGARRRARTHAGALEELDDDIRAGGGAATLVPLDLTDFDALDRLGAAIHERWGKLDILFGNAGILGDLTPLTHIDPPVWDAVMAVNVTANWRLIRSLDPLLRASDAGRAVFLSSGAAHKCTRLLGPLRDLEGRARGAGRAPMRPRPPRRPCASMLVNPGPLRTAMRRAAMPGEDPMTLKTPEDLSPSIVRLAAPAWSETGKIYDFPQDRVLTPHGPA